MRLVKKVRIAPTVAVIAVASALLIGCQNDSKPPAAAAMPTIPYQTRASVAEIMDSMVMPAADVLWNSTAVTESVEGEKDSRPKNDDDWKKVERAGVVLAEAINALMIPGRHANKPGAVSANPESELNPEQIQALIDKEPQVWTGFLQALDATVQKTQQAVGERNFDAISEAGGAMDEACENCHLHFWYPKQPE